MSEPSTSASASARFAFKKKKRPQAATRAVVGEDSSLQSSSVDPSETDNVSETLEELIALRKLKRATGGIQLERLNAGEKKRRPKAVEEGGKEGEVLTADGMVEGTQGGLQKGKDRMRDTEDDPDDASAKLRRGIHSNNFTGQTNAVDVDKHMMEYIEAELQKRKGDGAEVDVAAALRSLDPRDELYEINEKYKLAKLEGQEGNIQSSAAMLTAIPEVDLGIDRKLKNIEETERAKRAYYENRGKGRKDDGEFAAERFYRARRAPESDADALAKARAAAQGQPWEQPKKQRAGGAGGGRPQQATDDQVMDRFKKRQRK